MRFTPENITLLNVPPVPVVVPDTVPPEIVPVLMAPIIVPPALLTEPEMASDAPAPVALSVPLFVPPWKFSVAACRRRVQRGGIIDAAESGGAG